MIRTGARGFGLADRGEAMVHEAGQIVGSWRAALASRFSPVVAAVAATSLLAAALFVAVDLAELAGKGTVGGRDTAIHIAVAEPAASWPYSGAPIATFGDATPPRGQSLGAMVQRGASAFGLAFLAIGFSMSVGRRRAPEVRRKEELLGALPFGVACWTRKGRLTACNELYRMRLGGDGAALRRGASYTASVKRLIQGGYMRLISENESNRLIELHREDGSCLMIDERPLDDGGFITLITDVTENRRTHDLLDSIREEQRQLARRYHEEKLKAEAASRSKTAFLAHLSHDIRTPLNHIIGFADMMRQQTYGPIGDKRYLDYIQGMKDSGERLLNLFASILELAELESGRKPLRSESFAIDEMLTALTRRFAGQAQRAGLALSLAAPCGARLDADRFALERMAGNILENALRFTPAGGKVTVAAYAATDGVVIEITDTGIGMPAERLAMLSQPFAFGDAALAREHGGTGLGIAIARAIAELSGGRLAIDSRPALGTTVAISLPLTEADLAEGRQHAA